MAKKILISVVGPTAVGKTSTAIELAQLFNTDIISADSRQFFKELSIGTAKPTKEEQLEARHHFINNQSIQEEYNASKFEKEALSFLKEFYSKKELIILCGGSGMYVNALLNGFDEGLPTKDLKIREQLNSDLQENGIEALQSQLQKLDSKFYAEVDLLNSKRLMRAIEVCLISGKPFSSIRKGNHKKRDFHCIKIGLNRNRAELYQRINHRVDLMMQDGLLDEVNSVLAYKDKNALNTVGYKELFSYLDGECTLAHAIDKIKVNSRRFAKRQLTWFKKDSEIEWFHPNQKAEISMYIRKRIEQL